MSGEKGSTGWVPAVEGFSTNAIHAGQEPEQWNAKMVVPPIALAVTYKQQEPGLNSGYVYGRLGNPTRTCLEKCAASLENAKYALAFSSGVAATQAIINLLKAGDHVITTDDVYGGTNRMAAEEEKVLTPFFRQIAAKFNLEFSFVDFTNLKNVEDAIKSNTKLIWVETPTNPTMKVTDIKAVSEIAHRRKDILVVVDNTFMSSYFQRPLSLGADISYHSATKYLNGHCDVLMGLLMVNDDELKKRLYFIQYSTGSLPSGFDCYLVNRGIKTLALRMEKHQENALLVAKFLESHPLVEKVKYAGLPSHPQYDIMQKQASGCSGMLCFWMKGDLQQTKKFLASMKVFMCAESLGGFESLAEHPAIMTHATVPAEHRAMLGISDNFIRISVGLEDADDLIQDLDQALKSGVSG